MMRIENDLSLCKVHQPKLDPKLCNNSNGIVPAPGVYPPLMAQSLIKRWGKAFSSEARRFADLVFGLNGTFMSAGSIHFRRIIPNSVCCIFRLRYGT